MTDIFDPTHYEDVRRPLLDAVSLPPWCYTSDAFYRREVDAILTRSWNLVGRVDEIPNPGDYRVFDLCGRSAIVVRGDDGEVRALANTCRHRGTRLLDDSGHCRAIICPYHAWTYRFDGSLSGCRGMEKTRGFEKADHGLAPIQLGIWAGFIFVCFSDDCAGLDIWLGDLPEQFGSYRFETFELVRRKHYDLDCNWKLYIENAMEDYHTPTVHRSSIGLQETDLIETVGECLSLRPAWYRAHVQETDLIETVGEWDSIHMESEDTMAVLPGDTTPFPHVEGLEGRPASGDSFTVLYPTTFFGTTKDCMWWLQTIPDGPRRCRVIQGSCFPASTVARSDFGEHVGKYYRRWDKSIPEDNAISERQQAGLESPAAASGRLSVHEPVVHSFANWVLDRTIGRS